MVFHLGGLSSGGAVIRVVSQGGLSSGCAALLLIVFSLM